MPAPSLFEPAIDPPIRVTPDPAERTDRMPYPVDVTTPAPAADTPIDLHWPPPRTPQPPPADLLAAVPDPALAVDADGRTVAWTPAASERFGWPADRVLGSPPPLVPADQLPAYHRVLAQARAGVRVRDVLLTLMDARGRRLPAGVSAGPDGFGHVVLVVRPASSEDLPTAVPVPDAGPAAAVRDVAAVLAAAGATADRLVQRLPTWEPARHAAEQVRQAVHRAAALAGQAMGSRALTDTPPLPLSVGGPVLLADDDEAVRQAAKAALEAAGFRVLEAIAGDEAWRTAKAVRGPLPLLITDVVLPGLSGRMLADWLRAVRPGLRVVFVSGHPAPAADELPPGMTFLPKPFHADQLLSAVRRVQRASV